MFLAEHYVWDEDKALANERKHGITFGSARTVFDDPLADFFHDGSHADLEDRWIIFGMVEDDGLIAVVYTVDETEVGYYVRLISARKTTQRERREYESGNYSVREPEMTDEYGAKAASAAKVEQADEYDDGMAAEYDFSNGIRGVFKYCRFPVYVDNEVLWYFRTRAEPSGVDKRAGMTEAINEILRVHIGLPPRCTAPVELRSINGALRHHFGLPPRPAKSPVTSDDAERR